MDPRRLRLTAACLLTAGILARPAAADDVLTVALGGSVIHDSNLFRLPSSADPQLTLGQPTKSDTIRLTYAGLRIVKPYGQQNFQLDLTETQHRYNNFPRLDWDGFDYRAAWLWHLTPRVSGTLSTDRKQTPVSFADVPGSKRNVRNTDTRNFNLDGLIFGGWHVLLGATQKKQSSEVPSLLESDFQFTGAEAGVMYAAASGNTITVNQHSRRGEYVNRPLDSVNLIDKGFSESELELKLTYILSGKSTLKGRVGRRERRHDHFPQRDFSGPVGDLAYAWDPTGKLQLNVSAKRDIAPSSEPFSSYIVKDTLSLTPSWLTSAKTAVRFILSRATNEFRAPIVAPAGPSRVDTTRTATLVADWKPSNSVSLSASVQRQGRTSTNAAAEYATTVVTISAALSF